MRRKPFKSCSKFITGGNFKNSMADVFSTLLAEEEEKEEKEETIKEEKRTKAEILKNLEDDYSRILKRKTIFGKAYKIVFPQHKDLFFISFKATKSQATWEASKFFYDSMHPYFLGMKKEEIVKTCKAYRIQELDEYAKNGRVPIIVLMKKTGFTFSCNICGRHHFDYEDYCKNLCFIVEGDGNPLPFVEGYVVCYKCQEKYI